MQVIFNQTFENETIIFDGFKFIGCSFHKCIILINSDHCDYENCTFTETKFHVEALEDDQSMPSSSELVAPEIEAHYA
jgi:wyosine [tRNA(Phe)-imidazoG37] synthetase (radical SAM superfamily)